MTSKEALQRIKDDFEIKYDNLKNEKDRQNIIGLCEVIENDLETLDLVWLWLHNHKLEKSGLDQIKEWFDNDK